MGTWKSSPEQFRYGYDWRNPCQSHVFLGNGRIGAMFDRTGVRPRDYVVCKGIRRKGNLAGLFSLFTVPEYEHAGWSQTLDMYHGILATGHPGDPDGWGTRTLETFVHLKKNLIVFHYEPGGHREPKLIGLSLRPAGEFPAKTTRLQAAAKAGKVVTFDFEIEGDAARQDDSPLFRLTNDPFQTIQWSCQVSLGVEGEGEIKLDNGDAVSVLSGPSIVYLGFSASRDGAPVDAEDLVRQSLEAGFAAVRDEHRQAWEEFWQRTVVDIPYEDLRKLYIASLYYLRISAGSYSLTPSFFPLNAWRSEYMWDDTWMHHALLSSNQVDLADTVPRHWNSLLPWAKENLRKRTGGRGPGAIFDYLAVEPEYYRDAPEYPKDVFNLTLSAGLSAWRQYEYTANRAVLEAYYPLLKEVALMLLTYGLEPRGDALWIRRSQTTDESLGYGGAPNPSANSFMAKALLKNVARAASAMGEAEFSRRCLAAASRIEIASDGSVYLAFDGATEASDDTLLNFFPAMDVEDVEMASRTLDLYEDECFSTMGAACVKAWAKDRAVFPWVHFRVLIGEAMVGRPERVERFLEQMRLHNCYQGDWGVLPQLIHRLGYHDVPLLTPHAAFIQAINLWAKGRDPSC